MSEKPYILSIDDDVSSQLSIKKVLHDDFELGFINNFAKDSQECIDERLPDLIVLGRYMYLLDNESETHALLRSKDKCQNIPIISTFTKITETEKDIYLAMPLDKDKLLLSIKKLLNNQLKEIQ